MFTVHKIRMPTFSKVSNFHSKIHVKAPIFTSNTLCPSDPNDKLFPLA